MNPRIGAILALSCFFAAIGHAQPSLPEIDVGPAHIERPDDFTALGARTWENAGVAASEDLLRGVPGVSVARTGGTGQQSSIFIRGADAAGTLVLLDGLPLNDPSVNNHGFDFANLTLDNVERVEVWKGPQSVLFGSGATGGVINIVTKAGHGPLKASVTVSDGSQDTPDAGASLRGSTSRLDYALFAGRNTTAGISAASAEYGGSELDGNVQTSLSARLGYRASDSTRLELFGRWLERRTDLDYEMGVADARDYWTAGRTGSLGVKAEQAWSERWHSELLAAVNSQNRVYRADPTSDLPLTVDQHFHGLSEHFEEKNRARLFAGGELLFGPAFDYETMSSSFNDTGYTNAFSGKSESLAGFMTRLQVDQRLWFLTAGARLDSHNAFGTQKSWELAPGLHLTRDLDLFVRGAMGYKAPTLFELYDPKYGNAQLRPEHVRGGDISLLQYLDERRGQVQLTGFASHADNLLDAPVEHYENLGGARVTGAEVEAQWQRAWFGVHAGYTYLQTWDDEHGRSLLRRPRNELEARVDLGSDRVGHVLGMLEFESMDHRLDTDPITYRTVVTASHAVWNASVAWRASERWRFFARALNLTGLKYEDTAGYAAYPFSVYAGVTFTWSRAP